MSASLVVSTVSGTVTVTLMSASLGGLSNACRPAETLTTSGSGFLSREAPKTP
jgi:hypothetical protein